jgi:hypothetical protein
LPESISEIIQTEAANSYSGVWMRADEDLPEDSVQVIVMTDEHSLGFGYVLDGEWQLVLPPWDVTNEEEAVVLYWTDCPPPPRE